MFKQPSCRHPIFPDVNHTRLNGPITALGRRIIPHICPGTQALGTNAISWCVRQGSGIEGGHDVATVGDRGAGRPVGRARSAAEKLLRRPITLADLIAAIQDAVGPQVDKLVVATVRHLRGTGRVTGRGTDIRWGLPLSLRRT
jgi:hypothetical protein